MEVVSGGNNGFSPTNESTFLGREWYARKEGRNMKLRILVIFVCVLIAGLMMFCSRPSAKDVVIKKYSGDSLDGTIQLSGIEIDARVKSEGKGSLKISLTEPSVIRLFETGDMDIEEATLVYQAKLRTEGIQGRVYLEMWCHFEGKGEFFSRGLDSPLSGTNNWTSMEIPYFLKAGENPDNVKLNVVGEGSGTVWVDDIRLLKRPL
jgi:hypothetical protein